MTRRYVPDRDDTILTKLVRDWKRTDREAADEMGFSKEIIAANRNRMRLKANVRQAVPLREDDREPPPSKQDPLKQARRWLGDRLEERRSEFWLDGRPSKLDLVMKETYRVMRLNGMVVEIVNPRWEP